MATKKRAKQAPRARAPEPSKPAAKIQGKPARAATQPAAPEPSAARGKKAATKPEPTPRGRGKNAPPPEVHPEPASRGRGKKAPPPEVHTEPAPRGRGKKAAPAPEIHAEPPARGRGKKAAPPPPPAPKARGKKGAKPPEPPPAPKARGKKGAKPPEPPPVDDTPVKKRGARGKAPEVAPAEQPATAPPRVVRRGRRGAAAPENAPAPDTELASSRAELPASEATAPADHAEPTASAPRGKGRRSRRQRANDSALTDSERDLSVPTDVAAPSPDSSSDDAPTPDASEPAPQAAADAPVPAAKPKRRRGKQPVEEPAEPAPERTFELVETPEDAASSGEVSDDLLRDAEADSASAFGARSSADSRVGETDTTSAEAPPPEEDLEDTEAYLKGLLEAILFVSDRPLTIKELARAAKIDRKRTAELVEALRIDYAQRGLCINEVAGGLAVRTNPVYSDYVRSFLAQRPVRLSRPQLETLAIIAYRQPITRPEIDEIRGVDSGPVLKGLLERDLIKILGKKDEAGRPMLYGTSNGFLELFNLESLRQLPALKEFTELSEESRTAFEREIGEQPPENLSALDRDALTPDASSDGTLTPSDAAPADSDSSSDSPRSEGDSSADPTDSASSSADSFETPSDPSSLDDLDVPTDDDLALSALDDSDSPDRAFTDDAPDTEHDLDATPRAEDAEEAEDAGDAELEDDEDDDDDDFEDDDEDDLDDEDDEESDLDEDESDLDEASTGDVDEEPSESSAGDDEDVA